MLCTEVETVFIPWLMDAVDDSIEKEKTARRMLDGNRQGMLIRPLTSCAAIIMDMVQKRMKDHGVQQKSPEPEPEPVEECEAVSADVVTESDKADEEGKGDSSQPEDDATPADPAPAPDDAAEATPEVDTPTAAEEAEAPLRGDDNDDKSGSEEVTDKDEA